MELQSKLLDRIEEQLIEKFDKEFPNSLLDNDDPNRELSRSELLPILKQWCDFWIAERPIMKIESDVLVMKEHICNMKLAMMITYSKKWGLDKDLQKMYKGTASF